jgi:FkbM family methyltransferase
VRNLRANIPNESGYAWWWVSDFPKWEHSTFEVFDQFITPETIYIGFGEWIGPTVMFAAQIAKRAFALEPDPRAYKMLLENLEVNPAFNHKITAESICISDKRETLTMAGGGKSDSAVMRPENPNFEEIAKEPERYLFNVSCIHLVDFLRKHEALGVDMFIKVDTEGAETFLVPSWYDWLKIMDPKPKFFISMHRTLNKASKEVRDHFIRTMRLFKWIGLPGQEFSKGSEFDEDKICEMCDYICTDVLPDSWQ